MVSTTRHVGSSWRTHLCWAGDATNTANCPSRASTIRTEMVAAEMLAPLEGNIDYLRARYESWEEIPKDLAPLKIQMFRWRWIMMENNWLQNELGLLPEITWAQAEGRIQSHGNDCETRSYISEEAIRNLTLEFKRYLETLPDPYV